MIRLLYLAPILAILGLIFVGYLIFMRPVAVNNNGKAVSATEAVEELKADLQEVSKHQDLLAGILKEQRNSLMEEMKDASKLYDQANRTEFNDLELFKLKESVNMFNQQALDLVGNESAVIAFNNQLREGVAALNAQVKKIDLVELMYPKETVSNKLGSLKIQVAKLVTLQREIIAKSKEYNERAKESLSSLKSKLLDHSQKLSTLNKSRSIELAQQVEEAVVKQDQILKQYFDREKSLGEIRKQNLSQMVTSKERVSEMMEQLRTKMDDMKVKIESDQDKARDARERSRDNARDARQRAKDMQQRLKDRMNR